MIPRYDTIQGRKGIPAAICLSSRLQVEDKTEDGETTSTPRYSRLRIAGARF